MMRDLDKELTQALRRHIRRNIGWENGRAGLLDGISVQIGPPGGSLVLFLSYGSQSLIHRIAKGRMNAESARWVAAVYSL
jgi:hypothetical protein